MFEYLSVAVISVSCLRPSERYCGRVARSACSADYWRWSEACCGEMARNKSRRHTTPATRVGIRT